MVKATARAQRRRRRCKVNHDNDYVWFGDLTESGVENERLIRRADIAACLFVILMPEHYRQDGSCKCDDPSDTDMASWGYSWDPDTKRWR